MKNDKVYARIRSVEFSIKINTVAKYKLPELSKILHDANEIYEFITWEA